MLFFQGYFLGDVDLGFSRSSATRTLSCTPGYHPWPLQGVVIARVDIGS